MLAAMITAVALPPVYKSQAAIVIEAQQIPDEYVKSTITSYAEQRLEMLTREILRFNALKEIIEKFDLYPEYRKRGDLSSAGRKMKRTVKMTRLTIKAAQKNLRKGSVP